MIEYLKKNGLDLVAAFWLVVVTLQYISSYFLALGLDFKSVYYGMLVFTLAVVVWRICCDTHGDHDRTSMEASPASQRKSRRHRR